jgi:sulfonate transport system ATP-binding protein
LSQAVSAGAPTAVRLRGLRRSFGEQRVLDGVDLEIAAGEFVALLGASGSGKTTILRVLARLDQGADGEIEVPERSAVVFQEHRLLPWKRVDANVMLGLEPAVAADRAAELLAEVGLSDHARAWPKTLSGGEAQRVALARALARTPDLLLLDEPFGALDALTRIRMHALVLRLWASRRPAVLFVTHDVDEALRLADRAVVLVDGRIAANLPISSPRPRSRLAPELERSRLEILRHLGVADLA